MAKPSEDLQESVDLQAGATAVRRSLRNLSIDLGTDDPTRWTLVEQPINPNEIPVPGLALFVLRDLLGAHWTGREEKTAWTVYCRYREVPITLSLRKFGLRLGSPEPTPIDRTGLLDELSRAINAAEPTLSRIAEAQMADGRVTLANHFHQLDMRYAFFRRKGEEALAVRIEKEGEDLRAAVEAINRDIRRRQEVGYYATAAADAYFSRLEHILVLLAVLLGMSPKGGNLKRLIGMNWGPKFKTVFDLAADRPAKLVYDKLLKLKDGLRNPQSHGGFEHGVGSLFFHLPGNSALPATLSGVTDSYHFRFGPWGMDTDDQAQVYEALDACEAFLESERTRRAYEIIRSGLTFAFDDESLKAYQTAMASDADLDAFLRYESQRQDDAHNMDW